MKRDELTDLAAFATVARAGSFTRAAQELGLSQSALSHAMKALEARLGVRLLARTTRSVATTEAGERLLHRLSPALDEIAEGLSALGDLQGKPTGPLRIVATKHAIDTVMLPRLPGFLADYPGIRLDLISDDNLTDIVAERFDAGIRFGDIVEKDMIAVRLGPDIQMAVVGAPSYFATRSAPQTPQDLAAHLCLNYRHIKSGGLYAWEFVMGQRPVKVRVEGGLVFNNTDLMYSAALAGLGLAFVYADMAAEDLARGRLVRVLQPFCPVFPGYHLYHPSRRQTPAALSALIGALRFRG